VLERAKELQNARELIDKGAFGLQLLLDVIDAPRVVIVVDQFEEIFSRCHDDLERQHFFACLLGALAHKKLCLVITMRADFLGKCTEPEYAGLARYIQKHLVTVEPMTPAEFEQAITEPAKQVGLKIEPELTAAMLKDVEGPASLPLLEYTLTELWQQRRGNWLTLAEYVSLGGVQSILQKSADKVYQALTVTEQAVAQWIFLELTQLGEDTEDTRKPVFKSDLVTAKYAEGLVDRTLQIFTAARLVVMRALVVRGEGEKAVTVVDVAHEALIRHWPRLRGWLSENRNFKKWKDDLKRYMKTWIESEWEKDALLRGVKLLQAEEQKEKHSDKLSENELEFIQTSGMLRQQEQAEEQRRQEEREQLLKEAQLQAQMAKEQTQIALIEKLGAQSILATQLPSASNGYYEQALILAIQAFKEKNKHYNQP